MRPADAGWYRCEVTFVRPHDACPLHAEARLSVAPLLVRDASRGRLLHADDYVGPLRVGDDLALDCEGPGASWWSEGRSMRVATLRTRVTDRHRGQELRCGCEGGGVVVRLQVEAGSKAPPLTAVLSVVSDVVEGAELKAVCVASGAFPAASVTWFRDARVVAHGQRDEVRRVRATDGGELLTTASVLSVPARRHLHGATLSCAARNDASRRPVDSAKATIRVLCMHHHAPGVSPRISPAATFTSGKFSDPPGRATLVATPWTPLQGAAFSLRCLTSDLGRPPANSFEWTRDDRRLCAATPWPALRLIRATRGVYACRAVNAVGPGAASRAFLLEPMETPRIVRVYRRELRLTEGDAFPPKQPRCDARGLPQPSVLWRRQGNIYAAGVGDALALRSPVTREDAGVYVCEASNGIGVATATVVVNVSCERVVPATPLSPPPGRDSYSCRVSDAPECSVFPRGRRHLRCCARGNPPEVSVSWTLSGAALESNCSDVEAVSPGEYVCRPRNAVGVGRSCRATVTEAAGAEAETSLWLALGALASVAALSAGRRRLRRNCSCECGCGGGFTVLSRCSCFDGEAATDTVKSDAA